MFQQSEVNCEKKSILTPTQEMGFHLCSPTMKLSITSFAKSSITQRILEQVSILVREIAWFVGKTTMRAIPLALLLYQALQMQMNSVLPLNYNQEEILDKYNVILSLNQASREIWNGGWHSQQLLISPSDPSIRCIQPTLGNSASPTQGAYSLSTQHINYLKLLAAFLAIKAFEKTW